MSRSWRDPADRGTSVTRLLYPANCSPTPDLRPELSNWAHHICFQRTARPLVGACRARTVSL